MGFLCSELTAVAQVVVVWDLWGRRNFFSAKLSQECCPSNCGKVSRNARTHVRTLSLAWLWTHMSMQCWQRVTWLKQPFCESLLWKSELAAGAAVCCGGRNAWCKSFFFTGVERRLWNLRSSAPVAASSTARPHWRHQTEEQEASGNNLTCCLNGYLSYRYTQLVLQLTFSDIFSLNMQKAFLSLLFPCKSPVSCFRRVCIWSLPCKRRRVEAEIKQPSAARKWVRWWNGWYLSGKRLRRAGSWYGENMGVCDQARVWVHRMREKCVHV